MPTAFTLGAIPQTSDARQTTIFFDGLGRAIQQRERLGGTAAMNGSAHVSQNLSGYRVSGVVLYDGAGRVRATVDPFYASGGAYVDYRTAALDARYTSDTAAGGLSSALHATLRTYDGQGRPVCEAYKTLVAGSVVPTNAGACQSNFTESASAYTRAKATIYRGLTDPISGLPRLGVKVIAPENNAGVTPEGRAPNGPESFFDASGRLASIVDVDQNLTSYTYDLVGHVTGIVRSVAGGARPPIVTTITPDMMGRINERKDPNVGTRTFIYDAQGRLQKLQLPSHSVDNGLSGRDYIQFGYDLGRLSTTTLCTVSSVLSGSTWVVQPSCQVDSTLLYDASAPGYYYAVGRVAQVNNQFASIAYGYSPEGAVVRRDYTSVEGMPASAMFSATDAVRLDGLPTTSTLGTTYGSFAYDSYYDSFARPVTLQSTSGVHWSALTPASAAATGAFDAVGRAGFIDLDAARVHSTRQYLAASGLESASRVATTSYGDLHNIDQETYDGTRLKSYVDELGATTYRYWYSDAGRLKGYRATPNVTGPLSQNASLCASFNVTKSYGPGPSFGNLEQVRESTSGSLYTSSYLYNGTGMESATPPGPDAVTSVSVPEESVYGSNPDVIRQRRFLRSAHDSSTGQGECLHSVVV